MGSRRLSEAADTPPIELSMNRILVYTYYICSFFIFDGFEMALGGSGYTSNRIEYVPYISVYRSHMFLFYL